MRWVAFAALVGATIWYYGGFDTIINRYFPNSTQPLRSEPAEKTARKKKARNKPAGPLNSGTESASANEKKRKISAPVAGTGTTSATGSTEKVASPRDDNGTQDDKEFARQLASAKSGVDFKASNKKSGAKSKSRTVKQSTADLDSPQTSAETSSTGQDGDDETTPAGSPHFNAVLSSAAPDTSGVSDMLEPTQEGLKSIRLTGKWEDAKPKKPKVATKAPEPVETKKQKQQRRKREEEKERIAQSAKEHQAKGLQQMRTARMAEGTSNQTKADAFQVPTSVWTAKDNQIQQSAVKQNPTNAAFLKPLDTFESKPEIDACNSGGVMARPLSEIKDDDSTFTGVNGPKKDLGPPKTSALRASEREMAPEMDNSLRRTTSWADDVNEQEQMRMLTEDDPDAWSSVTNKKDKKKAKKAEEETNGIHDAAVNQVNGQRTAVNGNMNGASSKPQSKGQEANRYKTLETDNTTNGLEDAAWEP